jgi:hypothetical protein
MIWVTVVYGDCEVCGLNGDPRHRNTKSAVVGGAGFLFVTPFPSAPRSIRCYSAMYNGGLKAWVCDWVSFIYGLCFALPEDGDSAT